MNYVVIDTKKTSYCIVSSREKVEHFTNGAITKSFLTNIFTNDRQSRDKKVTHTDDRFIILPFKERNVLHVDKELLNKIISYK